MGLQRPGFEQAMVDIALQFDPAYDRASLQLRPSSGGKYLGLTLNITATCREQLDELYRSAEQPPDGQGGAVVRVQRAGSARLCRQPCRPCATSLRSARPDTEDELWLVEHAPVFTQGIAGRAEHVRDAQGIPVVQSNRGGQVTYHGPGQVVAYPLVDLRRLHIYVKEYVYRLEHAVLKVLEDHGVTGHRVAGAPGIYVRLDDPFGHAALAGPAPPGDPFRGLGKIAALGIKVSNHCAYHGVALNVAMDLSPFERIDPCGYAGLRDRRSGYTGRAHGLGDGGAATGPAAERPVDPLNAARAAADTMSTPDTPTDAARRYDAGAKQKAQAKTSRIPIKVVAAPVLKKPDWIRVKAGSPSTRFYEIKQILREHQLHTVCEEASCPNIGECFGKGTATFMIMGDKCTRRCPFCDVGHGRPDPLDADEPLNLARTIAALKLKYVVITSVDRDDLRDGGAAHFVDCIRRVRELSPATRIEILTPDFRGRMDRALDILKAAPPDVMNHNLETVPRLYKQARPGSDYAFSLNLLQRFKAGGARRADEERADGRPGRDRRGDPAGDARHARARHRHADHRPVPGAQRPPPAGAALRAPGHLPHVRGRGGEDGLHPCRRRRAGALQLPRRPAGARRGRGRRHRLRATPRTAGRAGRDSQCARQPPLASSNISALGRALMITSRPMREVRWPPRSMTSSSRPCSLISMKASEGTLAAPVGAQLAEVLAGERGFEDDGVRQAAAAELAAPRRA